MQKSGNISASFEKFGRYAGNSPLIFLILSSVLIM